MMRSGLCIALALSFGASCVPDETDSSELGESEDAVAVPAACQLVLGPTFRSGNTIIGYGSQSNCGTSGVTYLTIQRSRWYGWEDLSEATVKGSGHDVYVGYNCSGTGTHTFRTIQTGRTVGGDPMFAESNHIRETCN